MASEEQLGRLEFKAVPVSNLILSLDQKDSPYILPKKEQDRINRNLAVSTLYMSQSAAGRDALTAIADCRIRLFAEPGMANKDPDYKVMAGYDIKENCITFDTKYDPRMLHLSLIEQASCAATCHKMGIRNPAELSLRSGIIVSRAVRAAGTAAMLLHVEQCLGAERKDPERFVPPDMEIIINDISPAAAETARNARPFLKSGREDLFMQSVFHSFYDQPGQLAVQDTMLLKRYIDAHPTVTVYGTSEYGGIDEKEYATYMASDIACHEHISRSLTVNGAAFLGTGFSLDDTGHTALSPAKKVQTLFRELEESIIEDDGYDAMAADRGRDIRPSLVTHRLRGLLGPGIANNENSPDI